MEFGTRLLHTGHEVDRTTGAAAVPIYQVSTFGQPGLNTPGPYDYARSGNPTRQALEAIIAEVEGGVRGFAFASGLAALTSALMLFRAGDHLVVTDDCYGGTYRLLTRVLSRFGITASFVDTSDPVAVERAVRPNTRGLLVETISNPFLKRTDVRAMAEIARQHKLRLLVDNTLLTPCFCRPLEEGADIVIHSATKYLGGHSDLIAGVAAVRDPALADELYFIQNAVGAVLGPQDCFLVMRGIKTLQVRVERQAATAARIAEWLREREEVAEVYYPGVGAMVSFRLVSAAMTEPFVQRLHLPLLGVSLGAVESLVAVPARHSHASMPPEERLRRGITDDLIRFSVGIEEPADLLADLEQALVYAAAQVRS
ncbi:MAG: PLP-dependent aspartate aminotransferase family protein [Symbiobacterium sp.]|jgi:cystathionine beta-lyase (EC 4.4.1.8)|uniref:PLP-dependent aspartate aminotransferase family protein n=1 Tax=Symbiobacterium sp. TaxID=1971213 RepID=UPI003463BABF